MSDGRDLEPRHATKDGPPCTAGPDGGPCQRCTGFQPKHGAYAPPAQFTGRAVEIADAWRPLVPTYQPSDEPMLRLLGLVVARLETTAAAIDASENPVEAEGLLRRERALFNRMRHLLNDLGMSPTSRNRLGVDALRGRALLEHLEERYGAGEPEGPDAG